MYQASNFQNSIPSNLGKKRNLKIDSSIHPLDDKVARIEILPIDSPVSPPTIT